MTRAKMFRKLATETAARVPIPLDAKTRAGVAELLFGALSSIWRQLNARERGEVTRDPARLGTKLVLELVDPKTKRARPASVIADRVLLRLRPAALQIKPKSLSRKQKRARAARESRRRRSATGADA